jgi:hypothetical protein
MRYIDPALGTYVGDTVLSGMIRAIYQGRRALAGMIVNGGQLSERLSALSCVIVKLILRKSTNRELA